MKLGNNNLEISLRITPLNVRNLTYVLIGAADLYPDDYAISLRAIQGAMLGSFEGSQTTQSGIGLKILESALRSLMHDVQPKIWIQKGPIWVWISWDFRRLHKYR